MRLIWSKHVTLLLAAALSVTACQSSEEKAAAGAARFDRLFAKGDYKNARRAIQQALAATPDDPAMLSRLAQVDMARGALPQAYISFQRLVDLQPNNADALEILAQLAAASNDPEQTRRYLDTLSVLRPDSVRAKLAAATLAMNQRKLGDALRTIDGVLAEAPALDEAVVLKSRILTAAGRYGEAAAVLDRQVPITDKPEPMLRQIVKIYQQSGNTAKLLDTYSRLYAIDPANPAYRLQHARSLLSKGKVDEAMPILDQLRTAGRGNPSVRMAIVRAIADYRGRDAALAEIRDTVGGAPPAVVAAFAAYLLDQGEAADARRILQPIANRPPDADNVDAQVSLARADYTLGDRDAARRRADAVLAFDATNLRGLELRTEIALVDRDNEKALGLARLLTSSDPDNPQARILLTRVHLARNERFLAETAFRDAVHDFPSSVPVMMALTDYLVQQGKDDEAVDAVQDFTQLNPRSISGWRRQIALCRKTGDKMCVQIAVAQLKKGGVPVES